MLHGYHNDKKLTLPSNYGSSVQHVMAEANMGMW
jgi:hypothetical protein